MCPRVQVTGCCDWRALKGKWRGGWLVLVHWPFQGLDRLKRLARFVAGLTGAAAGAGVGGLAGALIGLGIPEEEANRYNEYFEAGKILVLVDEDARRPVL